VKIGKEKIVMGNVETNLYRTKERDWITKYLERRENEDLYYFL